MPKKKSTGETSAKNSIVPSSSATTIPKVVRTEMVAQTQERADDDALPRPLPGPPPDGGGRRARDPVVVTLTRPP